MKIFNVRLGLANNSSSSHSLILLPNVKDKTNDFDFGWDFFTASSKESKLGYLAITLRESLLSLCSEEVTNAVLAEWLGVNPKEAEDGYIDHQSRYILPSSWKNNGVDKEFLEDFKQFLLRDDLVILGGNDNDDSNHPLDNGTSFSLKLPQEESGKNYVCRKDKNYWTLFNRVSGAKIRVSFDDKAHAPVKSTAPELVDIALTSACPYGCKFCVIAGTQISTECGSISIEDVVVGQAVKTFSEETCQDSIQVVERVFENDYEGTLVEVETEDGRTLSLTANHQVFTTNRGWIVAGDLDCEDNLISL